MPFEKAIHQVEESHREHGVVQVAFGPTRLEHGVGLGKQSSLARELGEAVDVMRDIKHLFDPDDLMNPGKVVPI